MVVMEQITNGDVDLSDGQFRGFTAARDFVGFPVLSVRGEAWRGDLRRMTVQFWK